MAAQEGWVGIEEVAAHLQVAKESVYRWVQSKCLPAHRVGRLLRFKLSEVDNWVQACGGRPEENPWGVKFSRMFDMSNDSGLFRTREQLEAEGWVLRGNIFERNGERYLPLYEAKLFHQFDHRFATYNGKGRGGESTRNVTDAEKAKADMVVLPRYWVSEEDVAKRLDNGEMTRSIAVDRQTDNIPSPCRSRGWLLALRDITKVTNERTGIFGVIPCTALGHTGSFSPRCGAKGDERANLAYRI